MTDHDMHAHDNAQSKAAWDALKPPMRETKLLLASNPSSFGISPFKDLIHAVAVEYQIPERYLRGGPEPTTAEQVADMKIYYDQVNSSQWWDTASVDDVMQTLRFRSFVRRCMKKLKRRRPGFARCWNG
jgi:hypothetical protein